MTTMETEAATAIEVAPPAAARSVYGPVEIEWYPDRLRITIPGAGLIAVREPYACRGDGAAAVLEIAPPGLDELTETVPGAD